MAAMIGGYLHHSEIDKLGLTDSASAFLYVEAVAIQIYALGAIFYHHRSSGAWETPEFFHNAAVKGLLDGEKANGLRTDSFVPSIVNRLQEIDTSRDVDHPFAWSAERVKKIDPSADGKQIEMLLQSAAHRFFEDAVKMFS